MCKKTVHYTQRKNMYYILYMRIPVVMNINKAIITSTNIEASLMITGRTEDWRTALV